MFSRINFSYRLLILMAILIVLSFALPIVHLTNADSILTSATFLFSVIYGFEISVVIGNFSALKK